MRRLLKTTLILLAVLMILPVLVVIGLSVALNTGAGRNVAVRAVDHFGSGQIDIAGLGGHFPADIKLRHVEVADANGVWLTGDDLELRWAPEAILSRRLHVTDLTAGHIVVTRAPVAGKAAAKSTGGAPPSIRVDVDRLAVGTLDVPASLAGQPVRLALGGDVHLRNLSQGRVALTAMAANGRGYYAIEAAIDPRRVDTTMHVAEPADGLLGHFAGPRVHDPLTIDLTLAGPRNEAVLQAAASLGAARLDVAGTLGLDPNHPAADVMLRVPALAPFAAIAGQPVAGSTTLHFIVRRLDGGAMVSLAGQLALVQAPGPAAALVGPDGRLNLAMRFANGQMRIDNFDVAGAGFDASGTGAVAARGFDLDTHLVLNDVGLVSPRMSGRIEEDGTIIGTPEDFAVTAHLAGAVSQGHTASGPFSIAVDVRHLPSAPEGVLTGSGVLENSPLRLAAQFARHPDGATRIMVDQALWRSLNAKANIDLAAGAALPTGHATFTIKRLADFDDVSPVALSGSVAGDFSQPTSGNFGLNLVAQNLLVAPSLGAINATLAATGPTHALAVTLTATVAKLLDAPARIATRLVLDIDARSASVSALTVGWKTVDLALLGPAGVETRPDFAFRHLALAVNGGTLKLDGTISPRLDMNVSARHLPASLAAAIAPSINATGTLDATAAIKGSIAAPNGNITMAAHDIQAHAGPAAALPPADLTGSVALANKVAMVTAKLRLGPAVQLAADGRVPLAATGPISLHVTGVTDLRLLDPILAAAGTTVRGIVTPDITITGTPATPLANGTVLLANGALQNVASGLNLTQIAARIEATGRLIRLASLSSAAGSGTITGHGTIDLGRGDMPIDLAIDAAQATPVASDLVTEVLDAALRVTGALRGHMALGGTVDIRSANINLPKSLPPSVANLPIVDRGQPPPPAPPAPPDIGLDLKIRAKNRIFIRGDGLYAELGGKLVVGGTAAAPDPEGGFTLIRGYFQLAGKTLQFTKGVVSFNGAGFIPTLDLEASTTTSTNTTASLVVGGTAENPTITLSASPPLPSDEVLSQLLFGQATSSLSPFQAASLAAALASLSGVGGGALSDPLGGVRNALGLDELSLGGNGTGAPTVNAGRYVAPGVYVGAQQSTTGQGTQATVEINLYKGLQLQTATGTSGAGSGASSSVGLTYQFNY